jgi:hypothetical protein
MKPRYGHVKRCTYQNLAMEVWNWKMINKYGTTKTWQTKFGLVKMQVHDLSNTHNWEMHRKETWDLKFVKPPIITTKISICFCQWLLIARTSQIWTKMNVNECKKCPTHMR